MEDNSKKEIDEVSKLLWGSQCHQEIFNRWRQGFIFSTNEDSALVQHEGGPCSVLACVQAFIIKNLFFIHTHLKRGHLTQYEQQTLLTTSLIDILCQVSRESFVIALHVTNVDNNSNNESTQAYKDKTSSLLTGSSTISQQLTSSFSQPCNVNSSHSDSSPLMPNNNKKTVLDNISIKDFHDLIRLQQVERGCLERVVDELISSPSACLLFLYSICITKGLNKLKEEMSETEEPLIDAIHGHGIQNLTNLLLTGKAVSHVWDDTKQLSGLSLQGISHQSQIGFLTLMEHLRYIETGWNLKSPIYPIWLLASETHLTVFFCPDKELLEDNKVKRVFSKYDEEGRGFVRGDQISSVMGDLQLFNHPQYVDLMMTRLDPEQLGVVTFQSFNKEFYPTSSHDRWKVKKFRVYHFNGLIASSHLNQVKYRGGEMTVAQESDVQIVSDDDSPIRTCLMTRWPTVELQWDGGIIPSLN